jgi:hypothetical protein
VHKYCRCRCRLEITSGTLEGKRKENTRTQLFPEHGVLTGGVCLGSFFAPSKWFHRPGISTHLLDPYLKPKIRCTEFIERHHSADESSSTE